MAKNAIFKGLISDENGQPVETAMIGEEACYVVDDAGFKRHIPSESVDKQVLEYMRKQIEGNEEAIGEQTAKMLGQEDLFTHAMLINQLRNMGTQFDQLLQTGIPEEARAYLGMMGFNIQINMHGDVINISQPSAPNEGDGGN